MTRANASQREPQPVSLAFVIDIRTCDTEIGPNPLNRGVGRNWMAELLER